MSTITGGIRTTMTTTPFFHELKKQASLFFKDKIRTARLALTDVTPAELFTEEATNGNPWAPDARTMGFISRAAFEIDDFYRIIEILHKRLEKFDRKSWREAYQALVLLEHLLTHGPESVAEEFQCDGEVIEQMGSFQFIDERGFNWGLTVRKKSERVLKLLEKGPLLKEERSRVRKVSRGIQGFGSINYKWTSAGIGDVTEQGSGCAYGRSNSHYEDFYSGREKEHVAENQERNVDVGTKSHGNKKIETGKKSTEEDTDGEESCDLTSETNPLIVREETLIEFEDEHPFSNLEHQRMESTLLLSN